MKIESPKIDKRGAGRIYEHALKLARVYCPEWENVHKDRPDEKDPGIVLFRLFSKLAETVIGQMNRIPEKNLLAFCDLIGIDLLPSKPARVPLTFTLSEGSRNDVSVPERTKVASSEDPTVVFETVEPLTAINIKLKSAYSLNPWADTYTDHGPDINGSGKAFSLFGGDDSEKKMEHVLYLADDYFDFKTPPRITVKFTFKQGAAGYSKYFHECDTGTGKWFSPNGGFPSVVIDNMSVNKTAVDGITDRWISFRPANALLPGEDVSLPVIKNINCDISAKGIVPDAALFNDSPVEVKKGFYPFGEAPKAEDAFYIGCEEGFVKEGADITIYFDIKAGKKSADLKLSWEFWDGNKWSIEGLSNTDDFTQSGEKTVTFKCPPAKTVSVNGVPSRWIRARIVSGTYGQPGEYKKIKLAEIIAAAVVPQTRIDAAVLAAKDEISSELTRAKVKIPDDRVGLIFKMFKTNPGLLSAKFSEFFKDFSEKIKSQLQQKGITEGFTYIPPEYHPPFIKSLTIGYSVKNRKIGKCKTFNNFKYRDVDLSGPFQPFILQSDDSPSVYLGFEKDIAGKPVTVYFSLKTRLYSDIAPHIKKSGYTGELTVYEKARRLSCSCYRGGGWTELAVKDETDFFTKNGIIKFIFPSDISRQTLFGKDLYWVKFELEKGLWFEPPEIMGIYPNTVYAENAAVIRNEVLGSGSGETGQSCSFASKPVLEGQIIEIREPGVPPDEEMALIRSEAGSDSLRIEKDEKGDIKEVWARWSEVKTFGASTPKSRHYIIDRINGKIIFGNGKNGMIPPALPNNILAKYRSGGGVKGRQKENSVEDLKTAITNVEKVINHDSSSGGRNSESIGEMIKRAPLSLKNRYRAVTAEDFELLALEASPEVLKAKCIRGGNGMIQVIIVPVSDTDNPVPEAVLTDSVETYLKERAFAPVKNIVEVKGPSYKKIDVVTTIVPLLFSTSAVTADSVKRKLNLFFDPVKGGPEGNGWDFGMDIFLSEAASVIEGTDGVNYIKDLRIAEGANSTSIGKSTRLIIGENELPCAGEITVSLSGGET